MQFAITCLDKPASLELRMATRPPHLEYLQSIMAKLVLVGPLLDGEGKPNGSQWVVEVADRAEAEALAAGDPYAKAGLFESTVVRAFRTVFKDGEQV